MSIRIKPLKKTNRVLVATERQHRIHQNAIEQAFYTIGEIVGIRVNQLIKEGPKTGRIYRINGMDHQASAPGEAPANLTGTLAKSYNFNVHGYHQMEVGESAPYAAFLEDGTFRISPRPHVIRAIDETQGDAVRIFTDEYHKAKGGAGA